MLKHDSAIKHVTGESVYVNDINLDNQLLHGHLVCSSQTHAKIVSIDYKEAMECKGVVTILSHKDIPGNNQMGPVFHDEVCLAENEVHFIGQPIIDVRGERADGQWIMYIFIPKFDRAFLQGKDSDDLVRVNGEWKLSRLIFSCASSKSEK